MLKKLHGESQWDSKNCSLHSEVSLTKYNQAQTDQLSQQWLLPRSEEYKVNFDGTLDITSKARGLGIVIRDSASAMEQLLPEYLM